MELLNNYNLKDLPHDLILDGSESFYAKIPNECGFPIVVDYPYPIEAPSKNINDSILKEFYKYTVGHKETNYAKREYKRMKTDICNQDFKDYASLPEFLINYIQNDVNKEVNYGFNINYCYGTLEKFYNNGELCLMRPNIDNNLEIRRVDRPKEKIVSQWLYPDPIRSIKNINLSHSNGFTIRGHNNVYVIDIDEDFKTHIHVKLKCDIGYFDEAFNESNGFELALMDTNMKLKLFDLKKLKVITCYDMKELGFDSEPRLLKISYVTENTLMIMTDKDFKVLDTRCKDIPQEIEIKLHNCDMLLDFTSDKNKQDISNDVYLSSKHAFFIYDIRKASASDYIHHNLRFPPCFIKCFQERGTKIVTLFGQSTAEAAVFGTSSPYSLPYHIHTLDDTLDQCRSKKSLPVIPNVEKRLKYPITGVQMVSNDGDASIYFSNIFGEIFRQDVLLNSYRSEKPFEKMYEWLMKIYETDNPDLNIVHMANAREIFESDIEFNDVDLFNHYEKSHVHKFLEDEDFDHTNWNADNFDQIWNDENHVSELSLLKTESQGVKVEDWIMKNDFGSEFD